MLEYLKRLSSGPLGSVWLGRIVTGQDAGRLVVARCLAVSQLDEADCERILRAAGDFAAVTHPCLAKGLGARRDHEHLAILSEHVTGVPLTALRRIAFSQDAAFPSSVALRIVRDVLRAASALREQCAQSDLSVSGRIVLPDTVMVAAFGESLLSDLGVAAELCRCRSVRDLPELVGILSPEEIQTEGPAGERAEVFTVGVILWELLSGQRLFGRADCRQTLDAVLEAPIPDLNTVRQGGSKIPRGIAELVRRATSRDLAVRYPSLRTMSDAIDALPRGSLASDAEVQALLQQVAGDFLSDSEWCTARGLAGCPLNVTVSTSSPSSSLVTLAPLAEDHSPWEPPTLARKRPTLGSRESDPDGDARHDEDVCDGETAVHPMPEEGDAALGLSASEPDGERPEDEDFADGETVVHPMPEEGDAAFGLSASEPDGERPEDEDFADSETAAYFTPEEGDAGETAPDSVVPVTGLETLRSQRRFWRPGTRTLVLSGAAALALGAVALRMFWRDSEPKTLPAASPVSLASSTAPTAEPTPKREVPRVPREPEVSEREASGQRAEGQRRESEASCDPDSGSEGTQCRPASTLGRRAQPAAVRRVHSRSRRQSAGVPASVEDKEIEPPARRWGI